MKIIIFETAADFRQWLSKNHDKATELWLGMYNQRSRQTSINYKEALDEALCFGWIDGVRKSINETTYKQRFTPRKKTSRWSKVNIKRAAELCALGRMMPCGLAAFERRSQAPAGYSFEERPEGLDPSSEKEFRKHKQAWQFFQAQAPWYRRSASWWVISAKKDETKMRRLATLIQDSENERRLGMLTPKSKRRD